MSKLRLTRGDQRPLQLSHFSFLTPRPPGRISNPTSFMKLKPFVFLVYLVSSASLNAQETATPTRILGNIPDGTPPPPAPPEPPFIVAQRDIVSTTSHPQDGRTITVRQIKPIALPVPPKEVPSTAVIAPAIQAQVNEYSASHPRNETFFLEGTVYRSKSAPPRSLVHYNRVTDKEQITFWSSADFALIAGGIHSFVDSAGHSHTIFMSWGNVDIAPNTELESGHIREPIIPEIPDFPDGKATFKITGKQPEAEDLMVLQSLHDIYNKEYEHLLTAYEGRERARLQQQAYLKAHPPNPKNITLNYWRTETPTDASKGENQ